MTMETAAERSDKADPLKRLSPSFGPAQLVQHLQNLQKTGEFCDVVLHVHGQSFHLHRLVLSQSGFFRSCLDPRWNPSVKNVGIGIDTTMDLKLNNSSGVTFASSGAASCAAATPRTQARVTAQKRALSTESDASEPSDSSPASEAGLPKADARSFVAGATPIRTTLPPQQTRRHKKKKARREVTDSAQNLRNVPHDAEGDLESDTVSADQPQPCLHTSDDVNTPVPNSPGCSSVRRMPSDLASLADELLGARSRVWCSQGMIHIEVEPVPPKRADIANISESEQLLVHEGLLPAPVNSGMITIESVEALISFLYCEKPSITEDNVKDLMACSSFFDVPQLLEECAIFVFEHLSPTNVFEWMNLTNMLEFGKTGEIIRDACRAYLARNTPECLHIFKAQSAEAAIELLTSGEVWVKNEFQRYEYLRDCMRETSSRVRRAFELFNSKRISCWDLEAVLSNLLGENALPKTLDVEATWILQRCHGWIPGSGKFDRSTPSPRVLSRTHALEAERQDQSETVIFNGKPTSQQEFSAQLQQICGLEELSKSQAQEYEQLALYLLNAQRSSACNESNHLSTDVSFMDALSQLRNCVVRRPPHVELSPKSKVTFPHVDGLEKPKELTDEADCSDTSEPESSVSSDTEMFEVVGDDRESGRLTGHVCSNETPIADGACAISPERLISFKPSLTDFDHDSTQYVTDPPLVFNEKLVLFHLGHMYADGFFQVRFMHISHDDFTVLAADKVVPESKLHETFSLRKVMRDKISATYEGRHDCMKAIENCTHLPFVVRKQFIPSYRFGFSVKNILKGSNTRNSSLRGVSTRILMSATTEKVFFAGSLWSLELHRFEQVPPETGEYLSVYLQRHSCDAATAREYLGNELAFVDNRETGKFSFAVRLCGAPGAPTTHSICGRSSSGKLFGFEASQSWGWDDYLDISKLSEHSKWTSGDELRFLLSLTVM